MVSKKSKGGKSNFQYGMGRMNGSFLTLDLYGCQAEIFKVSKIAEPYVRQLRYRSLYNQGSVGEHLKTLKTHYSHTTSPRHTSANPKSPKRLGLARHGPRCGSYVYRKQTICDMRMYFDTTSCHWISIYSVSSSGVKKVKRGQE